MADQQAEQPDAAIGMDDMLAQAQQALKTGGSARPEVSAEWANVLEDLRSAHNSLGMFLEDADGGIPTLNDLGELFREVDRLDRTLLKLLHAKAAQPSIWAMAVLYMQGGHEGLCRDLADAARALGRDVPPEPPPAVVEPITAVRDGSAPDNDAAGGGLMVRGVRAGPILPSGSLVVPPE